MISKVKAVSRVFSLPDILDAGGTGLQKAAPRLTMYSAIIGAAVGVAAKDSKPLALPAAVGGGAYVAGFLLKKAAAALNRGSYDAAIANSVRGVREMKQTPEYTERLAEGLWDNVAQYKSCFGDGDRERVIENICYVLDDPMPQMEQEKRVGFNLSQVEDWRMSEIFESSLHKQYKNNLVLKSVRAETNIPFRDGVKILLSRLPENILQSLTQRRIYGLAGKSMRQINDGLGEDSMLLDAQPFVWNKDSLRKYIVDEFGSAVGLKVDDAMKGNAWRIFSDDVKVARRQIYGQFDSDYLESFVRRMVFDSNYTNGFLDQAPEADLVELEDLSGHRPLSPKGVERIVNGSGNVNGERAVVRDEQHERQLDQVRVHHYLAREHILFHNELVEGWLRVGDSKA